MRHARPRFGPRGDSLEHVADDRPCFAGPARHQRRSETRTFLAPGDAAAHEKNACGLERRLAPARVLEPGVAAVNKYVAAFEERPELVDGRVDGFAGRDTHHDPGMTR